MGGTQEVGAPSLSVIVPAFDEATHVRASLGRILKAVSSLDRAFEILLVDDGSRDATASEAQAVALEDARVRVVAHASNRGKGAALATGCAHARGDTLVFLDADLEITPEEIGPLLLRMESAGASVAVGSKYAPGARERRPLHRVLLSRLYYAVTSVLFRLPIRDTQTGLKILRRDVARAVVPAIVGRRWAWDVELLLLAHAIGARIVSGPVSVDFRERGVRIGWRGFLASGFDTVATFVRHRGLAAYGAAVSQAKGRRAPVRRAPAVLLSGDDLGLCASVDRGLLGAAAAKRLDAVSFLAEGPTAREAAAAARALAVTPDLGVHVVVGESCLATFLAKGALGLVPAADLREAVRRQVSHARSLGLTPTHLDAHRHAFLARPVYRAFAAEARQLGLCGIRFPAPAGALRCGVGLAGLAKGLVLFAAGLALRGIPHGFGLAAPVGVVDARVAAGWARAGRLPRSLRGSTFEVVSHPEEGESDVPAAERGIDRRADAGILGSLSGSLEALGCRRTTFAALAVPTSRRA